MNLATPATVARPAITSTIGALSDRELLRQTSTAFIMNATCRAPSSTTWPRLRPAVCICKRGCSSLFDYAVRERLRDGSLTLSAAAELQVGLRPAAAARVDRRHRVDGVWPGCEVGRG